MTEATAGNVTEMIGEQLPFLRRYARALTGSQSRGDSYAAATLEAILGDPDAFDRTVPANVALFNVFHGIWATAGAALETEEDGLRARVQQHLASLTSGTREALLLHTVENLSLADVGQVLDLSEEEAGNLVDIAYAEMAKSLSGSVMIIEDEAIIALDLESTITEMGHRVTGVARTRTAALELFEREKPNLILSDIQLADNSSGIDAVADILKNSPEIPVIFITAFPERLLTGDGPEPAFLIAKPYTVEQVRSAVSQAMFFSSTETLQA